MSHSILFLIISLVTKLATANISATTPTSGSVCNVGQACPIQWIESKDSPDLDDLGPTQVDLVQGDPTNLQVVQSLGKVEDPENQKQMTFIPDNNLPTGSD
uniref:Putative secreted protein n=1 Tax=Hemileia vastatrix TaxID=203904 RepID=T1UQ59_9BASI|nr:putative secreted protein [Hemileia vastatrix]